jgi:acyl CoA:acetate/3-ketoacid CoA transferase beta subunit
MFYFAATGTRSSRGDGMATTQRDHSSTRGDLCALACADAFRGDGAIMASGMAPLSRLGAQVAQATFEPNLVLTDGVARLVTLEGETEGWMPYSRVFDTLWSGKRHVIMGTSQLDRFGNQNLSCIGDHARPRVQLLGARGAPGNTVYHPTSYWVPDHSKRVFVPQVDFVSGVGTNRGAKEIRRVISNLGVFDFESSDGGMRIRSMHPGVTVEQVREATGFDVAVPSAIPESRGPTDAESEWLDRLDPGGAIRATVT